jgi:hypothetical protein
MSSIFISYNRDSAAVAGTLAGDCKALGHNVWFDQELSGGQAWWNQILAMIRSCDVFVLVLNPEALESTACKREYGYAADLGKPIVPVLVTEGLQLNLLPRILSQIQFVDYRKQDREAAFRLARALLAVPPPSLLPDPLPPEPEAPVSYLGNLTEQIDADTPLGYERQSALLVDLKRGLRNKETAEDTRTLLARLRSRHDLYAAIAEEIDDLLSPQKTGIAEQKRTGPERGSAGAATASPPASASASLADAQARKKSALVGGILGTALGVLIMTTVKAPNTAILLWGLVPGLGAAIGGAVCRKNGLCIAAAAAGGGAGWLIVMLIMGMNDSDAFSVGGIFGTPLGILAATGACALLRKRKKAS